MYFPFVKNMYICNVPNTICASPVSKVCTHKNQSASPSNVVCDSYIENKQTEVIFDLPFTPPALFHYHYHKREGGGVHVCEGQMQPLPLLTGKAPITSHIFIEQVNQLLSLCNYTPPVIIVVAKQGD